MSPEDHKVRTDTPGGVSLRYGLKIPHFRAFQLQLELIRDQGDKLTIGGLALRVCVVNISTNKI